MDSFSLLATVLGFVVDAISLYEIIKGINEKKNGKSMLNLILFVIGTIAIIMGLMGIFSGEREDHGTVSSENSETVISSENHDVSSDDISSDDTSSDTTSSEELDAEAIHQALREQSGKVWIDEMPVLDFNNDDSWYNKYSFEQSVLTNTGKTLNHVLSFATIDDTYWSKVRSPYIEFYLGGEYEKFNAVLALQNEKKDTKGEWQLVIQCDDTTVKETEIVSGFLPEEIDIDVTDITVLKIQVTNMNKRYHEASSHAIIAFGEAYFTKK